MKRELPPFLILLLIALGVTLYRLAVLHWLNLDPYVDEAYYWGWSQQLDWGYYSKPPVIAALIAASTAVLGNTLFAIKLPSLLLYPATALVLQRLGARLFDERSGFWAGLTFLTLPLVAALGLFVSTDAPLLFAWSLGMLLLHDCIHGTRPSKWLTLGLVVGFGLMSKYTMAAFIGSAFLVLLLLPRGQRALLTPGPWLTLLVALLCLAPNLWWNVQHDFPTFRHTAEITRLEHRAWAPDELMEFLGAQWLSLGPVLGLLFVGALLKLKARWSIHNMRFLLLFSLPLLLLVCIQAATGRANGNWAAPVFVSACVLVAAHQLHTVRAHRWLLLGIAINVIGAMALYHWPQLLPLSGKEMSGRNDPFKRVRGWSEVAAAIAPHINAHPDAILVAEDREVLAQLDFVLHLRHKASWNPEGHVLDHYQLTTHLDQAVGKDVLFIAKRLPADATTRFDAVQQLAEVDIAVHPDFHRRYGVFLMRNFHGY